MGLWMMGLRLMGSLIRMLVRKDLFNQLLELAGISVEYLNAKDEDIKWITVNGNHIPIKKGQ